jgi:alkylhydroperoxidase/carboxymuconolactone decarboxylase family protein YurZ
MKKNDHVLGKRVLAVKTENLIAIGAAMAANCIPCFEHLFEKAVTSGITVEEIRMAAEIAGLVKNGAHKAISGSIDELTGSEANSAPACKNSATGSCRC